MCDPLSTPICGLTVEIYKKAVAAAGFSDATAVDLLEVSTGGRTAIAARVQTDHAGRTLAIGRADIRFGGAVDGVLVGAGQQYSLAHGEAGKQMSNCNITVLRPQAIRLLWQRLRDRGLEENVELHPAFRQHCYFF